MVRSKTRKRSKERCLSFDINPAKLEAQPMFTCLYAIDSIYADPFGKRTAQASLMIGYVCFLAKISAKPD
jgi:hypothetical protein